MNRTNRTKKWFSREFDIDMPLWMFPNLLERLRGTPARIADRVKSLSRETLTHKKNTTTWSIQENIGHLLDLEPLWFGRLEDFENHKEMLRPADLENKKTYIADHNETSANELIAQLHEARGEIIRKLEFFDDALILRPSLHPRLNKPMTVLNLMYFLAEHDDHHLALISKILEEKKR